MALFKIFRGSSSALSSQSITDGYAWFTPDDGKFYIDYKPDNSVGERIQINANKATKDSDGNDISSTYIKKSVLSGAYDIIYSSATNTPTRLAANTSSTKKFLRMTGTGSAGAAPAWDTVTAADVGITITSSSVSNGTNTFNQYVHPTTAGNKHIPSGGSSGQFLKYSASGTATWSALPTASSSAAGIIQIGSSATQAAAGNHTHTTALAADTGTSTITLAFDGKYKLTAGDTSVVFTMPSGGSGSSVQIVRW